MELVKFEKKFKLDNDELIYVTVIEQFNYLVVEVFDEDTSLLSFKFSNDNKDIAYEFAEHLSKEVEDIATRYYAMDFVSVLYAKGAEFKETRQNMLNKYN